MADEPLELLDIVALLADRPGDGLVRGQVGTVVEVLSDADYEVEFVDGEGQTYALVPLHRGELLRLHHRRVNAA